MVLRARDWLDVIDSEYMARFVPMGGSAVKVVIGDADSISAADSGLDDAARRAGLLTLRIDSAPVRIHLIQNVFFAIAHEVDWEALAQKWMEARFSENGYVWPQSGERVPLSELAEVNSVAENLLTRSIHEWLTRGIAYDQSIAQDFRNAMMQLCLERLEPTDPQSSPPVVDWLRGTLRTIGPLRNVPIGARITRNNGRAMLRSLCRWLKLTGGAGMVVRIDLRHLGTTTLGPRGEARYSSAAVLDAFEVLREFIDDAELFEGLFLVCFGDKSLTDGDPRRSILSYPALRYRLEADVHGTLYSNPLAPLVALGEDGATAPHTDRHMPFLAERVAIEALRAGVPNRTAIRRLSSSEPSIESRFIDALTAMHEAEDGRIATPGLLIAGEFGAGKSHLLGHLAEVAMQRDFVVSKVTISKETPLFNAEKVLAAAIRNAEASHATDDVMRVAVERLLTQPDDLQQLEARVSDPASGFSPMFAALLHVLPKRVLTAEDRAAISRFFGGGKLGTPRLRAWLRAAGSLKLFDLGHVRMSELAEQRIRFAPQLFRAAGFGGWCILLDEVELIARYSTLQRGKSYAELARWLGLGESPRLSGIVAAAAITADFKDEMFDRRLDQEKIPALLEARDLYDARRLAQDGMAAIESRAHLLTPPDTSRLARSLEDVGWLYKESYGRVGHAELGEFRGNKQLRAYIKSWITGWDIERLFGVTDKIEISPLTPDYTENPDLETESPPAEAGDA